jgi:oxygen-independent coproporphyrinogen-3 oxidase
MTQPEPATSGVSADETGVGSVFVSNYPPFSFWSQEAVGEALAMIERPAEPGRPLGLYVHIPFCRKRCKFCYFKVYTDKDSGEIANYIDTVCREAERYARKAVIEGRPLEFVYFGGGTPSYISVKHFEVLVERLRSVLDWSQVKEFTFECEPGTLTQSKLEAIRAAGVTRLSLGVENFDDEILRLNGRAHISKEIYRVMPWIEALDFDQLNIDLIAGMIGETWETWKHSVEETLRLSPDSVTVYQLELPFNTRFSAQVLAGDDDAPEVADWPTKREWHDYAFERLAEAGYVVSSAYTMVKDPDSHFVYRNSVWQGCDLLGVGVSSFSHLNGFHLQNASNWVPYLEAIERGELPIDRAFATDPEERLTRELILQLKLGHIEPAYFQGKFGVDIAEHFKPAFDELEERGMLTRSQESVELTRPGLLQADSLLPTFYSDRYRGGRYT